MKKRILSLTLAAVMILAAVGAAAFAEEITLKTYYTFTENGSPVNVRNAPNGDIIGSLPYGTKIETMPFANNNWAMINFHYNDPTYGEGDWPAYVNKRFLIDMEPAEWKRMEEDQNAYTGDPMTDINAEFASAKEVEPYKITVRPARVTSWVNMRWSPTETGMIIGQYKATETLTVLKEMDHYLMVQDPDTGDVGYIQRKFALR